MLGGGIDHRRPAVSRIRYRRGEDHPGTIQTTSLTSQRHGLPKISVMDVAAKMTAEAGPYAGLDRYECRERILADLEGQGLVEKVEPHELAVAQCYRCRTVVEPMLSVSGS